MAHETFSRSTLLTKRNLLIVSFTAIIAIKLDLLKEGIELPLLKTEQDISIDKILIIVLLVLFYLLISFSVQCYGDYKNKLASASDELRNYSRDKLIKDSIKLKAVEFDNEVKRFVRKNREFESETTANIRNYFSGIFNTRSPAIELVELIFEEYKSTDRNIVKAIMIRNNSYAAYEQYSASDGAEFLSEIEGFFIEKLDLVFDRIEKKLGDKVYSSYLNLRLILECWFPLLFGIIAFYITIKNIYLCQLPKPSPPSR